MDEAAEARQLVDTLAGMFQQLFRKRLIAETYAQSARLYRFRQEYGLTVGSAAYLLGVPVEDVLRVSGPREKT